MLLLLTDMMLPLLCLLYFIRVDLLGSPLGTHCQVKAAVQTEAEKVQRLLQVFPKLATGGGQTLVFVDGRKAADSVAAQLTAGLKSEGYLLCRPATPAADAAAVQH